MNHRVILVPTKGEAERLKMSLPAGCEIKLTGFGLIEAGIRTSHLISQYSAEAMPHFIHMGIAGTFDLRRCPVGTAAVINVVQLDGVGVSSGGEFQSARDLGWAAEDRIELSDSISVGMTTRSIVSVAAASGDASDANRRRQRFPDIDAEDMETFAVARACQMAGARLSVIRGFSNQVGDRNHSNWKIDQALDAAAQCYLDLFANACHSDPDA